MLLFILGEKSLECKPACRKSQIATFSQYSTDNLNVNYNTSDLQKMIDAVTNINAFSAYVKEHVDELSEGIAADSADE